MAKIKLSDIVANNDLDTVEVGKKRQGTGIHARGRNAFMQALHGNQDLQSAAEQGIEELIVSVDDCRLWPYNDRIYDGLSMENCKSLVEDIQKNTQLQPVVARKDPTGKKQYEVIIGTRRFWACQHTTAKTIRVAVIEADDKQAYKIMRSENAERDDTTVYEKATNAKKVIGEIYGGSQKNYCLENDIREQTLSNWMAIADMEPEIVAVLPSMFEVSVKQAIKLRATINKGAKAKKAVLEKARELKGSETSTTGMLKAMIAAGEEAMKPKSRGPVTREYAVGGDKRGVVVKEAANGSITVKISNKAAGDRGAVLKALTGHLGQ